MQYWQKAEQLINVLVASRTDQKGLIRSPKAARMAVRMSLTSMAVRLAVAEDVLQGGQDLFGHAMSDSYERRCEAIGVKAFEA